MKVNVGIIGVSGYGGGETLRLTAAHPNFEVVYVAGESSAGTKLSERFPSIGGALGDLEIQKWDPENPPPVDLLFVSLPTGKSREAIARVSSETRIVDLGGDHRFVEGWTYGLADVWPEEVRAARRVANPGCYPTAALLALAPLLQAGLVDPASRIIIDAKSGVSGAGRGGESNLGFAEVNEDVIAYGLLNHAHLPEMKASVGRLGHQDFKLTFTPHLIPITRGILATCYVSGGCETATCLTQARRFYADKKFVRVVERPPHTKWAYGSNFAFVSYAASAAENMIVAMAGIDNLVKGAAGQAVQNANLMFGLPEDTGLGQAPMWP